MQHNNYDYSHNFIIIPYKTKQKFCAQSLATNLN